jgi:hypothetical protein
MVIYQVICSNVIKTIIYMAIILTGLCVSHNWRFEVGLLHAQLVKKVGKLHIRLMRLDKVHTAIILTDNS